MYDAELIKVALTNNHHMIAYHCQATKKIKHTGTEKQKENIKYSDKQTFKNKLDFFFLRTQNPIKLIISQNESFISKGALILMFKDLIFRDALILMFKGLSSRTYSTHPNLHAYIIPAFKGIFIPVLKDIHPSSMTHSSQFSWTHPSQSVEIYFNLSKASA